MNINSLIFFGLLLLPLVAFIAWLIKQDKKRSYWGILLLIVGMILAAYSIIVLDRKYTAPPENTIPKASSFK